MKYLGGRLRHRAPIWQKVQGAAASQQPFDLPHCMQHQQGFPGHWPLPPGHHFPVIVLHAGPFLSQPFPVGALPLASPHQTLLLPFHRTLLHVHTPLGIIKTWVSQGGGVVNGWDFYRDLHCLSGSCACLQDKLGTRGCLQNFCQDSEGLIGQQPLWRHSWDQGKHAVATDQPDPAQRHTPCMRLTATPVLIGTQLYYLAAVSDTTSL